MSAITVTDLNNAKLDVDHIAAIATSSSLTATDRLGGTKNTIAGMLALLDDEVVTSAAGEAAASALVAQNAAESAATNANIYDSVALGQAAHPTTYTGPNSFYQVKLGGLAADGVTPLSRQTMYQRTGSGTQSALFTVLPASEYDAAFALTPVDPSLVPLVTDDDGNVPLWLEDGKIGAIGLADSLVTAIQDAVGLEALDSGSTLVPLVTDDAGNVPVWLDSGRLDYFGLGPTASAAVNAAVDEQVSEYRFAPLAGPASSLLPISTDGRSLYAWRAKLAKLLRAGTGQAKIMFTGDSWTEYTAIPTQMAAILNALYVGKSGEGWISTRTNYPLNSITLTRSGGWVAYDASDGSLPELGCGIDGQGISTDATTETYEIDNLVTTHIDIYYRQTTGTFRWRVDAGAWTSVTGTGTNALGKVVITGLADSAHTIEIDTTGNAGTVSLYGFRATRPAVAGVELLKAGNASLDSSHLINYANSYVSGIAADIAPDLVIVALGTNDYRRSVTTTQYITALTALVTQIRAVSPMTGFLFLAPADTNATAVTPLTAFRDVLYEFCVTGGHEFYNHHDDWSDYDTMDSLGAWSDNLHVNSDGAYLLAKRIHSLLISL